MYIVVLILQYFATRTVVDTQGQVAVTLALETLWNYFLMTFYINEFG